MPFRFTCPIEVRFRDCDAMGHVNHAVYFTYFEVARFAYWRKLEIERLAGEVSYVIARAECDFRASVRTGDHLQVGVSVTGFGTTSFTMEYEITDEAGRDVARGKTVQVLYDYGARRPVSFPPELRERIEAFEGRREERA